MDYSIVPQFTEVNIEVSSPIFIGLLLIAETKFCRKCRGIT